MLATETKGARGHVALFDVGAGNNIKWSLSFLIHPLWRALKCSILGRGGDSATVRSKNTTIGATSGKRRWIGASNIYNFYIKHFRVTSILSSPVVIKIKCLGKCNLYNFGTKKDKDMARAPTGGGGADILPGDCFSR